MGYEWDFAIVFRDFDLLILGLVNTLKVTGLALLFGVPLGLFLALLRLFGSWPIKVPVVLSVSPNVAAVNALISKGETIGKAKKKQTI